MTTMTETPLTADERWALDLEAEDVVAYGREVYAPGPLSIIQTHPQAWAEIVAAKRASGPTQRETVVEELPAITGPAPAKVRTLELTIEQVVAMRDEIGRKFEPADVATNPSLALFATTWVREITTNPRKLEVGASFVLDMHTALERWHKLTPGQAKGILNLAVAEARTREVKVAATPQAPQRPPVTEAGVYMLDEIVYRVKPSQQGRLYALAFDPETQSFEYAAGAIKRLSSEDLMTVEQAEKFGQRFGICAVCGRVLTNPKSITRGIGPVCADKLGGE